MADSQDYFQVIVSQYDPIDITQEEDNKSKVKIYEVKISPSKRQRQTNLNLVESQFYDFEVLRLGARMVSVERRYSQFALIFEILCKKEPGFIFPAFPTNDLFAYMKSKVSIVKDEQFLKRRLLVIARFFNLIFNEPQFNPEINKEIKQFLSSGKEFEARKQIQKNNTGIFNLSWNKLKTYFQISKQNKYAEVQEKIENLKLQYAETHSKCSKLMELLKEQFDENSKLSEHKNQACLTKYIQMITNYTDEQSFHLKQLQNLQMNLFCEIEDLLMVNKIIYKINELKNNEENYNQLIKIEHKFSERIEECLTAKLKKRSVCQESLKAISQEIKQVARINQ